jgi:hypothetical protein
MIEEEKSKIPSKEEEVNKKLKALSEQKEREMALELLAQQIAESVSEDELDKLIEKVKKQRDIKPAD